MMARVFRQARLRWDLLSAAAIIVVLAGFRLTAYGDVRYSVGNGETMSYIESSRAPAFSWQSFAGRRLFTTNLIYKLANDPERCPLTAVSNPAEGKEVPVILQACFDRLATIQHVLAVFSWSLLAWMIAREFRSGPVRILAAAIILAFAYTPQIAEWDSILSPESLTMSLFVLSLALLVELSFHARGTGARWSRPQILMGTGLLLTFTLWIFVRDVNLYSLLVTIPMAILLLLISRRELRPGLAVCAGVLVAIFALGYFTARDSLRATRYPLVHAFEDYILPFPSRVEWFDAKGMPDPASQAYLPWLDKNASSTYAAFLVSHPGFVLQSLWENLAYFRAEYTQQYDKGEQTWGRATLLSLGEMLHPESNVVYLVILLCTTAIGVRAAAPASITQRTWLWLVTWFLLVSVVVLLVSFFGDTNAFRRHLYPSVESLRLLMWLALLIVLDGYASSKAQSPELERATPGNSQVKVQDGYASPTSVAAMVPQGVTRALSNPEPGWSS
ncbi:MAG TPA: hypothetical protein VIU38_10215 [Anaerolineales bacterium]